MSAEIKKLIDDKQAVVGVIGLGYVGLPLVKAFIEAGFRTIGFDVDASKVKSLLAGKSYIKHLASEWISGCIQEGKFDPTSDLSRMAEADALLICVPTPLSDILKWYRK